MALDDDVRNLARNPTFSQLETEALRFLAFSAETRILRAGDVLFRRGEPADGGYVVLSGSIALLREDDGAEAERLLGPHSLIGELALITETKRPTTAMAREPSSVIKISRTLFHRILQEFPNSAERLRHYIAQDLKSFVSQLVQADSFKS